MGNSFRTLQQLPKKVFSSLPDFLQFENSTHLLFVLSASFPNPIDVSYVSEKYEPQLLSVWFFLTGNARHSVSLFPVWKRCSSTEALNRGESDRCSSQSQVHRFYMEMVIGCTLTLLCQKHCWNPIWSPCVRLAGTAPLLRFCPCHIDDNSFRTLLQVGSVNQLFATSSGHLLGAGRPKGGMLPEQFGRTFSWNTERTEPPPTHPTPCRLCHVWNLSSCLI